MDYILKTNQDPGVCSPKYMPKFPAFKISMEDELGAEVEVVLGESVVTTAHFI